MTPMVKKVLAGIAVVSALASVVAGREKADLKEVQPVARIDTRVRVADDIDLAKLDERRDEGAKVDAFAPRNFSPLVPAQQQAHARPAKAEAPPLPFRYLGKWIEGDKLAVFLANGSESFTVSAGERLGDYRVDAVSEAEIRFTYLPLKTKQSLPL